VAILIVRAACNHISAEKNGMNKALDAAIIRRLRGLLRLAECNAEAETANADPWQYAVSIDVLRNEEGLTNMDLRWLVNEGLADCCVETTRSHAKRRTFRQTGAIKFTLSACFVPSVTGMCLAQRAFCVFDAASVGDSKPNWDPLTGDWTLDSVLVKHLSERATKQRRFLDACEAGEWCNPMPNPFADLPPIKRSHHLRQLLDHLHHGQQEAQIRFSSFEKGRYFRWTIVKGRLTIPLRPSSRNGQLGRH
jgi:hypothetical protein